MLQKAYSGQSPENLQSLLDLYEASFDAKWLVEAKKLSEEMIELFTDSEGGGFFLTGTDGENLIARSKPSSDGAIPSGNSIAALALLRLDRLTMSHDFAEQGSRILNAFSSQLEQSPIYSSAMLFALDFWLGPQREIVIAGDVNAVDTQHMFKLVHSKFLPNAVVLLHDRDNTDSGLYEIVPFIKHQIVLDSKATAYVCENYTCQQPVTDIDEFERLLDGRIAYLPGNSQGHSNSAERR